MKNPNVAGAPNKILFSTFHSPSQRCATEAEHVRSSIGERASLGIGCLRLESTVV